MIDINNMKPNADDLRIASLISKEIISHCKENNLIPKIDESENEELEGFLTTGAVNFMFSLRAQNNEGDALSIVDLVENFIIATIPIASNVISKAGNDKKEVSKVEIKEVVANKKMEIDDALTRVFKLIDKKKKTEVEKQLFNLLKDKVYASEKN